MKMDAIIREWDKDCRIDKTELGAESSNIPNVHNKYLKILMQEKYRLTVLKTEQKKTKNLLNEYYKGELTDQELKTLGREQFLKIGIKQEIENYIESDNLMVEITLKIAAQSQKVEYVNEIIKMLNNRNWQIRNAIDWEKFIQGQ